MDFFSNDQNKLSLMDSLYLPEYPSYIPFNIQEKHEELSNELCFHSSSLAEIFNSSKLKLEDSKNMKKMRKKSGSKKKVMEEKPPTDYIHVRARRGQATDSHSLAERVRREKISVRMKTLQNLVPGCDKVTGKAFILDEIINYVESLKNQVEFLSMKLASLNPNLYEFGFNFDDFTCTTEYVESNLQLHSSMNQSSHIQSQGDNITVTASSSASVLEGLGTTAFDQDADGYFMQVSNQTEGLGDQFDLYTMCSFE